MHAPVQSHIESVNCVSIQMHFAQVWHIKFIDIIMILFESYSKVQI